MSAHAVILSVLGHRFPPSSSLICVRFRPRDKGAADIDECLLQRWGFCRPVLRRRLLCTVAYDPLEVPHLTPQLRKQLLMIVKGGYSAVPNTMISMDVHRAALHSLIVEILQVLERGRLASASLLLNRKLRLNT